MVPRCYAFLVMMGYWLLHSLIDWNDVEGMRDQHKDALRDHILRKDGPERGGRGMRAESEGKGRHQPFPSLLMHVMIKRGCWARTPPPPLQLRLEVSARLANAWSPMVIF